MTTEKKKFMMKLGGFGIVLGTISLISGLIGSLVLVIRYGGVDSQFAMMRDGLTPTMVDQLDMGADFFVRYGLLVFIIGLTLFVRGIVANSEASYLAGKRVK